MIEPSPSTPPTDTPELEKLLDEYHEAVLGWQYGADHDKPREIGPDGPRAQRMYAARSALLEEYARLKKELKFAARSALLLDDQFKEVCAELASLRAEVERTTLTESEWHFLFGLPLHPGCEPSCQTELDRICEKLRPQSLRRISGYTSGGEK